MMATRLLAVTMAAASCFHLFPMNVDAFVSYLGSQTLAPSTCALGNTQFCGLQHHRRSPRVARMLARRASAGTRRGHAPVEMIFDTLAENMSAVASLFAGEKTISERR